jgi:hypothetical protein
LDRTLAANIEESVKTRPEDGALLDLSALEKDRELKKRNKMAYSISGIKEAT